MELAGPDPTQGLVLAELMGRAMTRMTGTGR
jgi:hypothetical protein